MQSGAMQRGRASIFVYTGDFGNRKRHRYDCYAGLVQPTSFSRAPLLSPRVHIALTYLNGYSNKCAEQYSSVPFSSAQYAEPPN